MRYNAVLSLGFFLTGLMLCLICASGIDLWKGGEKRKNHLPTLKRRESRMPRDAEHGSGLPMLTFEAWKGTLPE